MEGGSEERREEIGYRNVSLEHNLICSAKVHLLPPHGNTPARREMGMCQNCERITTKCINTLGHATQQETLW